LRRWLQLVLLMVMLMLVLLLLSRRYARFRGSILALRLV